jgi:hypothetical protein
MFLDQANGFDAVFALRDHIYVADSLQQKRQLIASQLLIVNNDGGKRHYAHPRSKAKYISRKRGTFSSALTWPYA